MRRTEWPEVTFRDFAALCRRRGYDLDFLVARFAGQFGCGDGMVRETTRQYFERVHQGRYADNVIVYRCLIEFYERELAFHQDVTGEERRCGCGCGQRIFGRKKWASAGCKQRGYRQRVGDMPDPPEKVPGFPTPNRNVFGKHVG